MSSLYMNTCALCESASAFLIARKLESRGKTRRITFTSTIPHVVTLCAAIKEAILCRTAEIGQQDTMHGGGLHFPGANFLDRLLHRTSKSTNGQQTYKAAHDTSWSRYGRYGYHQCPERRPITTDASVIRHCPHNPPPCSAQEAHPPHSITRGMQGLLLIGFGCSRNIRIAALRAARHADITSEKACFASTTRPGSASGCARQCFSRHLS